MPPDHTSSHRKDSRALKGNLRLAQFGSMLGSAISPSTQHTKVKADCIKNMEAISTVVFESTVRRVCFPILSVNDCRLDSDTTRKRCLQQGPPV